MVQDDLKDRILEWCSQSSEIAVVQDREEPGAEVALLLRLQRPEGIRLGVFKSPGQDRVSVLHSLRFSPGSVKLGELSQGPGAPATLTEAVERVIEARPGSLTGSSRQTSDGQEVTLTSTIYTDGLTKHAFMTAIQELARVRRVLDRMHSGEPAEINPVFPGGVAAGRETSSEVTSEEGVAAEEKIPSAAAAAVGSGASPAAVVATPVEVPSPAIASPGDSGTPGPTPSPEGTPAEAAAKTEVPEGEPTPEGSQAQPVPQPEADREPVPAAAVPSGAKPAEWAPRPAATTQQPAPTAQPAPAPAAGGWSPSHRVPPAGMDAWAVPDPTQRAIARIDGGVPVQVTETAGAWAHILCSNGWTGWVDYRILVPAGR